MFRFRLVGSNTPDRIKYMLSVNWWGINLLNARKLKLYHINFLTDSKISIARSSNTHITHKSIFCSKFLIKQLLRTESHFKVTNTILPHCIFFLFFMNVYSSCKLQVNCKKVVVFFLNKVRSLYMLIWYSANCNLNYVPLRVRLIVVELMIHQQMS